MSKSLLFETKSVLKELGSLRKSVEIQYNRYADYREYILVDSNRKGSSKKHLYLKQKGRNARHYLGKDSAGTVESIRSSRYLEQLLQVLDRDIQLLEAVNRDFVIPDHSNINAMLPKVYKMEDPPAIMPASPKAKDWKRRMEAEKAKYPVYRPEELVHRANDGTMMRSLSEVQIANRLLSLGIPFVYELPLFHHGKKRVPDFTILSPIDNTTVIIIEHQGAMDNVNYQSKYISSLLFYLGTNMVPNKDVFFTFNHLNGKIDTRQIDSILWIAFGFDSGSSPDSC